MKFNKNMYTIILVLFVFINSVTLKKFKRKANKIQSWKNNLMFTNEAAAEAYPRSGCVALYTSCSYGGNTTEICEDDLDFKNLITTKFTNTPASMKLGQYVNAKVFPTTNYQGTPKRVVNNTDCFTKEVGLE